MSNQCPFAGGTSVLGYQTALGLVHRGAEVVIAMVIVSNMEEAEKSQCYLQCCYMLSKVT
jgi:NAD(P)-dependent dehydrogenase (short-subunit alcohol dehydrogenase family)